MLIPIIKDFNNTFSYLVSTEKAKGIVDSVSRLPSSEAAGDGARMVVGPPPEGSDIFQIGWAAIQIFFSFGVKAIQYIVSFQWLRDFTYLPISIPANISGSTQGNLQNLHTLGHSGPLQRFLHSNTSLTTIPSNGGGTNSWSLSFLSNEWFDPLTVPVNFISTSSEAGFPHSPTFTNGAVSNIIIMSIFICAATGFSSFFNSFFISFPLSLSNLLSLRYLIVQKFWAGCFSVLGIVFGEICFMLFLILPPPFMSITLIYLESVWPYIFGLSLTVFIIFDYICNPYPNTVSFSSLIPSLRPTKQPGIDKSLSMAGSTFKASINPWFIKIFGLSFLLSLTEQSCCFAFFGSLNLSSTANFLDTYLFAASSSPIILFFSCLGFLIGSFLAIIIYDLVIAKIIFLGAEARRAYSVKALPSFLARFWPPYRRTARSPIREKTVLQMLKHAFQFLINYLPGGKRIFSGQARSRRQATKKQVLVYSPVSIETTVEDMLRSGPWLATPGARTDLDTGRPSLGDSTLYNRIDKILLTCLITLSFTTIPYYSFDYLVNSFFGFIPQDEILNAHSLRVNFPDYTNLLGITLSDNNSVINTDVSLYDRAHFMYGEWPNSFESLNYQGELMWTNLRDHRRQKRTRRSTRLKFKTLKTKISTSWKEFKRNSGFSSSNISSSSREPWNDRSQQAQVLTEKKDQRWTPLPNPIYKIFRPSLGRVKTESPEARSRETTSLPNTSLSETIKPLSTSSFMDLSGGEKVIKTYPKNWKKAITEKYYQNPIYQTILTTDLKNFLKREPLSQPLTNNQENELYFLRVKMAHYYDSLRFYFNLRSSFTQGREERGQSLVSRPAESETSAGEAYGPFPPFQFKSLTSMNYRQQFKGTLKTVKQLFAISLPARDAEQEGVGTSRAYPDQQHLAPLQGREKYYKYDRYLFNEYAYSKNEFLHEESRLKRETRPESSETRKTPRSVSGSTSRFRDSSHMPNGVGIRFASKTIYNMFGSNDPFYVGWDKNLRKFVLTSRILTRSNALLNHTSRGLNKPATPIYRPYTSWPFFKHELKNLPNRPYFVLYENYLNILNKRIHLFSNININDIDTKSLTFLYSYSFNNNVKKYVSQLPINLYKQAMRPSSLENLFTPTSNSRSSFLWPGSIRPAWEYYFW